MRYEKVTAGEWLRPKRRGYKMRCCDCGLVHRLDFRVHTGRAEFRAFRDNRATAAIRRRPRAQSGTNTRAVAGPKAVMPNRKSRGATQDRLAVSNNRLAEKVAFARGFRLGAARQKRLQLNGSE